jgi:hypothetical protein
LSLSYCAIDNNLEEAFVLGAVKQLIKILGTTANGALQVVSLAALTYLMDKSKLDILMMEIVLKIL